MPYLLNLLIVLLLLTGAQVHAETPEEEARERAERSAGPEGYREGMDTHQTIEIYLDGQKIGTLTSEILKQLTEKRIFTPRGPKRGRSVVEAIKSQGVGEAKTVWFIDNKGERLKLLWNDLVNWPYEVVLTYNFKGHLVLETDGSDRIPDHTRDKEEDKVRETMHKQRQRSLIFLRHVSRIEIESN